MRYGKKRRNPGWWEVVVVVHYLTYLEKEIFDPVYQSLQNTYTGKEDAAESVLNCAEERTPECNGKYRTADVGSGAARATTKDVHDLLAEAGSFRLLPPLLLDVRTLHWRCAVRGQVRLAVLELCLRGSLWRC